MTDQLERETGRSCEHPMPSRVAQQEKLTLFVLYFWSLLQKLLRAFAALLIVSASVVVREQTKRKNGSRREPLCEPAKERGRQEVQGFWLREGVKAVVSSSAFGPPLLPPIAVHHHGKLTVRLSSLVCRLAFARVSPACPGFVG
jgi:hypothetical protein